MNIIRKTTHTALTQIQSEDTTTRLSIELTRTAESETWRINMSARCETMVVKREAIERLVTSLYEMLHESRTRTGRLISFNKASLECEFEESPVLPPYYSVLSFDEQNYAVLRDVFDGNRQVLIEVDDSVTPPKIIDVKSP